MHAQALTNTNESPHKHSHPHLHAYAYTLAHTYKQTHPHARTDTHVRQAMHLPIGRVHQLGKHDLCRRRDVLQLVVHHLTVGVAAPRPHDAGLVHRDGVRVPAPHGHDPRAIALFVATNGPASGRRSQQCSDGRGRACTAVGVKANHLCGLKDVCTAVRRREHADT
jgi:hypothetical protein